MLLPGGIASSSAHAQAVSAVAEDHAVVFELGWAAQWSPGEGAQSKGATFAFEVTPIENWLEIEVGVSAIRADSGTEIPIDVLFKKPWTVSPQFEVMVGSVLSGFTPRVQIRRPIGVCQRCWI